MAFLFHASLDSVSDFIFIAFSFSAADQVRMYWLMAVVAFIWAIGLILVDGPANLSRNPGVKAEVLDKSAVGAD